MKPTALCLSLLGLALPGTALAQEYDDVAPAGPHRTFMFTGDGVEPGVGRFALGLDMIVAGTDEVVGALPALELRYARGVSDMIDVRLSLDTIAVYNSFDAGVGIALVRGANFGLGLRAGVTGIAIITSEGGGAVFAGTPGAVVTFRGDAAAFSLGLDVPMFFNGFVITPSQASSGSGFIASFRPNVALEIGGGGTGAKFYVRGDADVFLAEGGAAILGNVALGVHF